MTLPNVNDWMTSLSSLQIVPPPQYPTQNVCKDDGTGSEKKPPAPQIPDARCEEQRDDANTANEEDKFPLASKHSGAQITPPTIFGRQQSPVSELHYTSDIRFRCRSIGRRDGIGDVETSANEVDVDKDSIVATAAKLTRGRMTNSGTNVQHHRRQRSLSRKDDITPAAPLSNASPFAESGKNKTSSNLLSDILSGNIKGNQHHNIASQPMIMIGTQRVYPRTLMQPSIHHSVATDLWIATIKTDTSSTPSASVAKNNDAKVKQKEFSFHDEKAARASAYANSPPIPVPLGTTSLCMLCDTSFSFLRRPKHCKNCGIVICALCSVRWSMKMLPETYTNNSTLKLGKTVRVCVSCDAVAKRFKNALLLGRYDTALESYLTGNVNLRCPFVFKGEKEIMFPIHCAIIGQSERLLRWLVDVQCCPIHLVSTTHKGQKFYEEGVVPTLLTSKGRSVMDIAMETKHVGILRYLVKERGVSVREVKDLGLALSAFEAIIMEFPEEVEDVLTEIENRPGKSGRNRMYTSTKAYRKRSDSDINQQYANENSGVDSKRQHESYTHQNSMAAPSLHTKVFIPRDIQALKERGLNETL